MIDDRIILHDNCDFLSSVMQGTAVKHNTALKRVTIKCLHDYNEVFI